MRRPIVFVTDYGRDDSYAAALIGAAMRFGTDLRYIEGTHGVPPGNVLAGAYHLKALALAFDRSVVLCAVVDPGVGTTRRAIAIQVEDLLCVAPDNGLISYIWAEAPRDSRSAVMLDAPWDAAPTFHGRDVFAPAAAQLATGTRLADAGEPISDPTLLDEAFAERSVYSVQGRVAVVDHFGNAITTVRASDIGGRSITRVAWSGGATTQSASTYGVIADGLAAIIGSAGHLEIAARGASAASLGGPAAHAPVTVELA